MNSDPCQGRQRPPTQTDQEREIARLRYALDESCTRFAHLERISDARRALLKAVGRDLEASVSDLEEANRQLREEIDRRARVEADLAESKQNLEARVLERTQTLNQANQALRRVPALLLEAQERERDRLARDLHDGIIQNLFTMRMFLESERLVLRDAAPDADLRGFSRISSLVLDTIDDLRRIISDLRPPVLEEVGLAAALRTLMGRFLTLVPDGEAVLDYRLDEELLGPELKTALFRVTQEALTNALRHSGATALRLSVEHRGGEVRYAFRDNGRGLGKDGPPPGSGIPGMRERARLLGGRFELHGAPGQGLEIRIALPLAAPAS